MPPDVFLLLASSGITLVASFLYLVDERPSPEKPDDPRTHVGYCLPPMRVKPPPLPRPRWAVVDMSNARMRGVMTLRPDGSDWLVTLEVEARDDGAALEAIAPGILAAVSDVRLKGKAELARPSKRVWKVKPGQA